MKVGNLDRRERQRMDAALKTGEPILLELQAAPPPEIRLDDLVPLCHAVRTWDAALTRSLQAFLPPPARPGRDLKVSAIIPTCRQTPLGLCALRNQDLSVEVIVLLNDGASGEGRPKVEVEGDRVVWVPWEGHGATRQRGVELAEGEYVLFTVDDAIPMGAGFVRTMVEALEDGDYEAVYARQIPWPGSDPVTCRRLREWTPPGHQVFPSVRLDHVAALYRRSTLVDNPLPAVSIAEDLRWAKGRRVGYVPMAPVVHAHQRRPLSLYRRTLETHRQIIASGEPPRVPDLPSALASLPGLVRPALEGGPVEILNQFAELLGQWRAGRN